MISIRSTPLRKTQPVSSVTQGSSTRPDDDAVLIRGCQEGNRDSQRALYERHSQHVYRLMYRIAGGTNADDLTQQVFLRAFQTIGQFAGRSAFSTWLYRLATNEALQFLRRSSRHPLQCNVADPEDGRASPHASLEDREALEHALAQLAPDLRVLLVMREIEGLSYYELALAFDIAEGTVASRLNRARSVLRQLLE